MSGELIPKWVQWWINEYSQNIRETVGNVHTPRILKYHSYTSLKATSDEISWCSSAMCACMEELGIPSTKSAAAISWVDWGFPVKDFVLGAVAVFKRDAHPNAAHVAIALKDNGDSIMVIGGNQKDAITIMAMPKNKLICYRWPKGVN